MVKKIKKLLLIIACNAAVLLAGIFLIEYIFGNWRGARGIERLIVPRNFSIEWDISEMYPSETGKALYKRDRLGLRGPFKEISQVELLTVGGSTTDQRLVTEGRTWQDVLAEDFRKEGKNLQIVNAGIDGQSALGHARSVRIWLRLIPELKPRYTLAYVGVNDLCFSPDIYADYFADENSWRSLIARKSALYYLFRTLRGFFYMRGKSDYKVRRERLIQNKTNKGLIEDYGIFNDELAAYEVRLRKLIRRIREIESEPVMVTQMINHNRGENGGIVGNNNTFPCWNKTVNEVDSVNILNLVNKRTLKVCAEEGLTCFDLANELRFGPEDFYDLEHNTPSGSEKIGHYLYRKMKELNLF